MARYSYSRAHVIPIYDCDLFCRLRPSAMLQYIQSVAGEHLDALGLTYHRLYDEGFVFVVAGTALKVHRAPAVGEHIVISTAPFTGRGANMLRETVLHDTSGALLAECQTNWALIDSRTSRLLRASGFPYTLPMLEGEWTPFFDPTRIRIHPHDGLGDSVERIVRISDLDQNLHMNNTVYADILTDCFGDAYIDSCGIDTLFLRYHLQAKLHDRLTLKYGCDGQLFVVSAHRGEKKCFEGAFSLKPLETV
ncbi:MAG TPA: acyl-ACP thioesterase domain-containing protein [Clostridia bacterium]|nr:acyl-ACP thioesterase domain-containing protein [Clostridia bacterium]